ncbi:hypothetical protein LEMLEM_LOCUS1087 [Lemmus lemmus]
MCTCKACVTLGTVRAPLYGSGAGQGPGDGKNTQRTWVVAEEISQTPPCIQA